MWFGLGVMGLIIWIAIAFGPAGVAARKGQASSDTSSGLEWPQPLILASVGTAPDRRLQGPREDRRDGPWMDRLSRQPARQK